jgi:hypothetical protein
MSEFRKILADGDLISQKEMASGWWLFGEKKWEPYRNLSREVRFLEQRMHDHHAAYTSAREDFVVAQKNVNLDADFLRKYKSDNSEVIYIIPSDESILARRDAVKYGGSNGSSGDQKKQGEPSKGNQQAPQSKGGGENQGQQRNNHQAPRGKTRPLIDALLESLMNTRVAAAH